MAGRKPAKSTPSNKDGGPDGPRSEALTSDSTAFRTIDRIASEPAMIDVLRSAHAQARARFWELSGAPGRLTIDVDATLIAAHSEKENAAGNYKHGYGFHPLGAYGDETREALAMQLRPGNAGANTAADHITVIDRSLAQIPADQRCPRAACGGQLGSERDAHDQVDRAVDYSARRADPVSPTSAPAPPRSRSQNQ